MKRAMLRFDAGGPIGLGHAMRARAVAAVLVERGWSCRFAVNPEAVALLPADAAGDALTVGGPAAQQAEALRAADPSGPELLLVDHYGLERAFEAELRDWAGRIAVIDDLADRSHDCDLLVDSAPRTAADYAALVPVSCRVLTGPWFAPIRADFARRRARALQRRRSDPLRTVAISFGGSDNQDLIDPALRVVREVLPDVRVEVYAAGAGQGRDVAALLEYLGLAGEVLAFVDDPAARLAAVDLVIGAAGVSVWERCVLGLPSLVVPTSDNQQANAAALHTAAAAQVVALPTAREEGGLRRR